VKKEESKDSKQKESPKTSKPSGGAGVSPSPATPPPTAVSAVVEPAVDDKKKKKKKGGNNAAEATATAGDEAEWETAVDKKKEKQLKRQADKAVEAAASLLLSASAAAMPTSAATRSLLAAAAATAAPSGVLNDSKSLSLDIDKKHYPKIIGKGGETLKLFCEKTGAKIELPKRDSSSSTITISGTEEAVEAARKNLEMLVEKGYCPLTDPGVVGGSISVPEKSKALLLGPQGAHLKALQTAFTVKISVPNSESSSSQVQITGETANVKKCKAEIKALLNDGFTEVTHPGWVKETVAFPQSMFGILIGPKGNTIKSIQGNNKPVKINMPDKGSLEDNVTVIGPAPQVERTVKAIQALQASREAANNEDDLDSTGMSPAPLADSGDAWGGAAPLQDEDW